MKLVESNFLNHQNFGNLLATPTGNWQLGTYHWKFHPTSKDLWDVYLRQNSLFMSSFHFHGGGAYFHGKHSPTGAYDKHFMIPHFPKWWPDSFCTKMPVCSLGGSRIKWCAKRPKITRKTASYFSHCLKGTVMKNFLRVWTPDPNLPFIGPQALRLLPL